MTNPDNIVRVRARNGGRASVYEANGWAQAYTSGLLEGNGVVQNTSADMNVLVGGSATKPDVVLAVNPAGYKIALDLVGQQPLTLTTPASNSRVSAIVAYTDDLALASTEDSVTGSPASCGLIVVNGTAAADPSEPSDTQIRNAITADGATGSQAAYCVIATVLVANDTTTITDSLITIKNVALGGDGLVTADNIDFTTLTNPDMPFKSTSINLPYAVPATLTRMGNIVFVTVNSHVANIGTTLPQSTEADEFTPAWYTGGGYTPRDDVSLSISAFATFSGAATFRFKSNGKIQVGTYFSQTGNVRVSGSACWVTDDEWPS